MYLCDVMLRDKALAGLVTVPDELADLVRTSEFDRYQPTSVELHLHPIVQIQQKDGSTKEHDLRTKALTLKQGDCLRASTIELVNLVDPDGQKSYLARVEGKSSLARQFLLVHCTGGFIDPAFRGQITLEIAALGKAPVTLTAGQKIAQLAVSECYTPAWPYGHERRKSKYQNQSGPTEARPEPEEV